MLLAVTRDDGATLDALERAERARLLHAVPEAAGRFAFYHELVVQALADDIPVSARMREHERIALALAARGAAAPQLARHFSEAAPLGHATAARRWARAASDEAMAVFAFELAAERYARARWVHALAASPDEAEGVALDVLGRLERLLGRLDEAERRLRDAAALCERMGAQAHLSLARHELAGVLVASGRGLAEAQRLAEAAAGLGVALPQWAPVTTSTRRQSGSSR